MRPMPQERQPAHQRLGPKVPNPPGAGSEKTRIRREQRKAAQARKASQQAEEQGVDDPIDIDEGSGGTVPEPTTGERELTLGPRPVRRRLWMPKPVPEQRPGENGVEVDGGQPTVQMVKVAQADDDFWGDESPACEFAFSDASDGEGECSWVTQIYEASDEKFASGIKQSAVGRRQAIKTVETQVAAETAEEMTIPLDVSKHHMRPLYVKAWINGQPIRRVFIDGGATINIMPLATVTKVGKNRADLLPTGMKVASFAGALTKAVGSIVLELTVGTKTLPTVFFVIDALTAYTALLGRDWIHSAKCVPSTLHQKLWMWNSDGKVEEVEGDHPPFSAAPVFAADASLFTDNIQPFLTAVGDKIDRLVECHWSEDGYEFVFAAEED